MNDNELLIAMLNVEKIITNEIDYPVTIKPSSTSNKYIYLQLYVSLQYQDKVQIEKYIKDFKDLLDKSGIEYTNIPSNEDPEYWKYGVSIRKEDILTLFGYLRITATKTYF